MNTTVLVEVMSMKEEIKEMRLSEGVAEVGFSYMEEVPYKGLHTAITLVVRLLDPVVDGIENAPTKDYFHHYRTVNAYIDRLTLKTCLLLEKEGFSAAPIPASQSVSTLAGLFPHKAAAVSAGLGWIGKSDLFISYEEVVRVRLGTVLTDCPIPVEKHSYRGECGDCRVCAVKCPAMAILGKNYEPGMRREEIYDAEACSRHMKSAYQTIGRGAVCGICMRYCPKKGNKKP